MVQNQTVATIFFRLAPNQVSWQWTAASQNILIDSLMCRDVLQLSLAVVTRRGLSGMPKQHVLVSQVVPA